MASLTSSPSFSTKPTVDREFNTFIKGIITEASPLIFPESASLDEQNFVLNNDGSRNRRFGIEYEDEGDLITKSSFTPGNTASRGMSNFRWNNIASDAEAIVLVVQVGGSIYLFDATKPNPTAVPLNDGDGTLLPGADSSQVAQYATINGTLIITMANEVVYQIIYDAVEDKVVDQDGNESANAIQINLRVRDIWGIDEPIDPDTGKILADDKRPTDLTNIHEYNLMNQGWPRSVSTTDSNTGGGLKFNSDPILLTKTTEEDTTPIIGAFPSNGDIWFLGKQTGGDQISSIGTFNAFTLNAFAPSNFKAPRGKFIIDPFTRGTSREAAIPPGTPLINSPLGLDSDLTTGGILSVASFAGRAFYSLSEDSIANGSDTSPRFDGAILFTRIVRNADDLSRCHSDNDPTDETFSDLLDSDGGYLTIPEASNIRKLVATGRSLVVFADNGIWQLSGGNDNQFSAGNFFINKISNVGALGSTSIVEAEGLIFYWGEGGIYMIQPNQLGDLSVNNLSEERIQTLYNAIPSAGRVFAKGIYDPSLKIVSWIYNDNDPSEYDGIDFRFKYNKELLFDVQLSAFYKNVIGEITDGPFISAAVISPLFASLENTLDVVTDNGQDDVFTNNLADDVVITEQALTSAPLSQTKYLTFIPGDNPTVDNYSFTYSLYRQTDFIDWLTFDDTGIDSPAFLETGYEILGDTQRRKQSKYLTMNFRRTEDGFTIVEGNLESTNESSCIVQARWDYADTINSGKFGRPFQAYRLVRNYIPSGPTDPFDYGLRVLATKSKLRGRGRSLYLRMDSEPGKNMHIYGWAIEFTAGRSV